MTMRLTHFDSTKKICDIVTENTIVELSEFIHIFLPQERAEEYVNLFKNVKLIAKNYDGRILIDYINKDEQIQNTICEVSPQESMYNMYNLLLDTLKDMKRIYSFMQ